MQSMTVLKKSFAGENLMSSITTNDTSLRADKTNSPKVTTGNQWTERFTTILSVTQGLLPLLVAVVILWWFGTVLTKMFTHANSDITAETWARYTYLFNGLEAIAFAAAGFLFGREVNRQRADRAEQSAAQSQAIAFEAQSTAAVSEANGQALAEGVRALHEAGGMHSETSSESAIAATTVNVEMLRSMADTMFPAARRSEK
jgi:hypothetical protein